ncbi:MAG: DUF1552 domain-containing protein [Pirellulales bacterium]
MNLPRRTVLRAASTAVALPALPSLGWKAFAAERPATPPKRMVFLGFGWGVTKETWFPDVKQAGSDWTLPPGLAPLERHKAGITVVQNLANKFMNEAHWGSTFWLTGANRYAEPGQSFHNSISADQVAAEVLGRDTRYASLQLSCDKGEDSGHGPGLSLAWNRQGKPVAGYTNPVAAYHRLFSAETTPLEVRQAALRRQQSVLDTVLEDAAGIAGGLGREDADKLAEYLQSIRDIETRLAKESQWLDKPKPAPAEPFAEPQGELEGAEEIRLMYDLLVAALQTDTTRVVTYRQPVASLLTSLGITFTGHNMSHYAPGPRMEASQKRDAKQAELLAHLLDRLQAVKEPDGSSLFDHTCVVYGSNIQSIHYLENCPTLIAGRGAGIALGRHVVAPKNTPLCNAWLTLLQGVGIDIDQHGDSTGPLDDLLA